MLSENQDKIKGEAEPAVNNLVRDAKREGKAMLEDAAKGAQNKLEHTVMDVKQKTKDSL